MKVVVDRTKLVDAIKHLRAISGGKGDYSNTVGFYAKEGFLYVVGVMSFINVVGGTLVIKIAADVKKEGVCYTSQDIVSILQAAADGIITLNVDKRIVVTGTSGFKASFQPLAVTPLPFDTILRTVEQEFVTMAWVQTSDLKRLVQVSRAMPGVGVGQNQQFVYVEFDVDSSIRGRIQESEIGSVEEMPLIGNVEGERTNICVDTSMISSVLGLCGERVVLSMGHERENPVLVRDLDQPFWWGIFAQLAR